MRLQDIGNEKIQSRIGAEGKKREVYSPEGKIWGGPGEKGTPKRGMELFYGVLNDMKNGLFYLMQRRTSAALNAGGLGNRGGKVSSGFRSKNSFRFSSGPIKLLYVPLGEGQAISPGSRALEQNEGGSFIR